MVQDIGLIGFGEAASTFARVGGWGRAARAFDVKTDDPVTRSAILKSYKKAGVSPCQSLSEALSGVSLVISLVTADQALAAAEAAALLIGPGVLYCDFNSVAPGTKQAAARAIEEAGARYIDIAVMAPVDAGRLAVPLLLSGDSAPDAQTDMKGLGFARTHIVGPRVGQASSIKMIRSVLVKGLEALTAECVLAAQEVDVLDEVLASLDASECAKPWSERADYSLDRMMIHGVRRAAEMQEVVKMLAGLGIDAAMTLAAVERQRAIGALGFRAPPQGLTAKIESIVCNINQDGRAATA